MIELVVDGKSVLTMNDDNSIVVKDKKKFGLDDTVVESDNVPDFVKIQDIQDIN